MTPARSIAAVLPELDRLRTALGPALATRGWLTQIAERAVVLEVSGASHFGGGRRRPRPDVLVYWLAEQAERGWGQLRITAYMARLCAERTGRQ